MEKTDEKAQKYLSAKQLLDNADGLEDLKKASVMFECLGDYKIAQVLSLESKYRYGKRLVNNACNAKDYGEAAEVFEQLRNYKDSADKFKECCLKRDNPDVDIVVHRGKRKCRMLALS